MNVRTTLADIDPALVAAAEDVARSDGRTVASVFDEALAAFLARHHEARQAAAIAKAEDIIRRYPETLRILAQ